jgi:hypothetical protein
MMAASNEMETSCKIYELPGITNTQENKKDMITSQDCWREKADMGEEFWWQELQSAPDVNKL